jgi:predicted nucleic acid-binding protein
LSIVIDASVALAWVFGDERHEAAWRIVERLRHEPALVPAHYSLEIANGLLSGLRRGRLTPDQARTAIVALAALPIEIDFDTARQAFSETGPLALQHRLTMYDAAYLELAWRRGLPLATLDDSLAQAAAARGVQLAIPAD